jgi:Fe-S-cluster-containing hydrogenase component 2/CRP-like cAMP-binding protein
VLYGEGAPSDAVYLVRSGTIKLARKSAQSSGRELVFSYLGRGAAFGFESLLPSRRRTPLVLRCVSHPDLTPPVLIAGTLTIGRSAACEVRVPEDDLSVGRRHCKLEERDGEITLTDLDSANHTFLNGAQIQSARIVAGDRIQVVDYSFEVTRRSADATVLGDGIGRFATATGLDSFEVVRLPIEALRPLRSANPKFADALLRLGRQLESASTVSPELVEGMVELNLYNSQNTLLIDLERCTRCDECVKACSDAHGGVSRFTRDGPRFGKYLVTMACRSCTDPKCMIGCPVGSIRRGDSLEIRIEDWCIGCERCANQCPFGNINMIDIGGAPADEAKAKVEDAAPPAKEAAQLRATVCDLCTGYDGPNCVYACPHDAAIRVNPNDFLAEADRRGLLG